MGTAAGIDGRATEEMTDRLLPGRTERIGRGISLTRSANGCRRRRAAAAVESDFHSLTSPHVVLLVCHKKCIVRRLLRISSQ
jgi:hypothetical protein